MENIERELKKFDAEMKARLPKDISPLFIIREKGCDNPYFTLSEDAKRIVCKYGYCKHFGVCKVAG